MFRGTIPTASLLRSSNPTAEATSPFKGMPAGFESCCAIRNSAVLEAIRASHYQTAEGAYRDVGKHPEIFIGDDLLMRVFVDEFGNPGTVVQAEYAIRRPGTIRALLPGDVYPRHQAATPCHLTEQDINQIVLAAIRQGVPFSWTIVRTKFKQAGDILVFWPTHVPAYGAAACDKLGDCVHPSIFTQEQPFDPAVIHVGVPWLSQQEFHGSYVIACGSGRKRLVVVNGGPYDGGVKKPINFQHFDRALPHGTNFITTHWAMTKFRNGRVGAIGTTTAAGKSEGSSDEGLLKVPGRIVWQLPGGRIILVDLPNIGTQVKGPRLIGSDDITAVTVRPDGTPCGVEIEPTHFLRADLCDGPGTLPIAEDCAAGKIRGRIHWTGVEFDPQTRRFIPWSHVMIGGTGKNTNPRVSYRVENHPEVVPTSAENPMGIDYLILSVPVPEIPEGWHMPSFLRLSVRDFLIHNSHGARANKGNPALGAVGNGYWAFEGFGGKKGFTLDTEAAMFNRDLYKFWMALNPKTPCFVVFNGFSVGGRQEFKFSATYLLRALLEQHHDALLQAPLLKIPGVFSGGVPDLSTFLSDDAIPREVWDPRTINPQYLERDARMFDGFGYDAMNRILGQVGLSDDTERWLCDQMRRFSIAA